MSDMLLLFIVFFANGVLLVLLSLPMIAGKVPPNPFYGFRTRSTLEDPELWYPANRYLAQWLLVSGLVISGLTLALFLLAALGVPGFNILTISSVMLGVMVITMGVSIGRSMSYLSALKREKQAHRFEPKE
ncbi:MAG: SdpI family protein [Chloroflexota bacterium]